MSVQTDDSRLVASSWMSRVSMRASVFISYNREAAAPYAWAICKDIKARHPCEVVLDEEFLDLGEEFERVITDEIRKSSAFIFIIHQGWFLTDPGTGLPPANNPRNWMRRELLIALQSKVKVLPILLDGATMAPAEDLPQISAVGKLNAVTMHSSSMGLALAKIAEVLDPILLGDFMTELKRYLDPRLLLQECLSYPWNFLRILFAPRQVVPVLIHDRREALVVVRSQLFLIISLVLFAIMSAPVFAAQSHAAVFVTVQAVMLWAMTLGSSRLVQWSWRCVGGKERRSYRYVSLNAYYCALCCVVSLWITLAALGIEIVFDRPFVDRLAKADLLEIARLLIEHFPASPTLQIATAVLLVGNLLMLVWTLAFWDVYRALNEVGRLEAARAFVISSVAFLPVGAVYVAVQAGMSFALK